MKPMVIFAIAMAFIGCAYCLGFTTPDPDKDTHEYIAINLNSSCDTNRVVVTHRDGGPIEGVHVTVRDVYTGKEVASGDTDADGLYSFVGCSLKVDIKAAREDFATETLTSTLVTCSACTGTQTSCSNDTGCFDDELCSRGACVPVPCPCGVIGSHQCSIYDCCSDSDCDSGSTCVQHACEEGEPAPEGCASDSDCLDAEYCATTTGDERGTCTPVQEGQCGVVQNHSFVQYGYECGSEPGCPSCPAGYACSGHACAPAGGLSCPVTGTVGESKTCDATSGGTPCVDCEYYVTDPAGATTRGTTDAYGNFNVPLSSAGTYTVALTVNGTIVKEVQVVSNPKGQPQGGNGQSAGVMDYLPIVGGLVVVIVILALAYFVLGRGKGQQGQPQAPPKEGQPGPGPGGQGAGPGVK